MGHVHIDVPDLAIARIDQQDFLRRLDDIDRLDDEQRKSRNAARQAAPARRGPEFAREHLVVVAFQFRDGPGLQIGVVEIGDAVGRGARLIVAPEGIFRIVGHGLGTRTRDRREVRIDRDPSIVEGREIGNGGAVSRRQHAGGGAQPKRAAATALTRQSPRCGRRGRRSTQIWT